MARYWDGTKKTANQYEIKSIEKRTRPLMLSTMLENVRAKVRDDGDEELAEAILAYRRRIEKSDGNVNYVLAEMSAYAGRHKKLDEFLNKEVPER